jgi:hypothetical protein
VKKLVAIGIIIAIVIAIGIASVTLYGNISDSNNSSAPQEVPVNGVGRHFSVELKESVGVSEKP